MGVISNTIKLHAYYPIDFMHTGKSQKKTKVKLDCSINKTVYCSFLTTYLNYVGMPVVYKEIYYSYRLSMIFNLQYIN